MQFIAVCRYSYELKVDTAKVNKDCFREKKLRRKAREIVKNVFEQRYLFVCLFVCLFVYFVCLCL